MKEVLFNIPNFPEYQITNTGKIWSKPKKRRHTGKFLKPVLHKTGYLKVNLCRANRHYNKLINRLVLETFIGPCPEGMECCHDNDIKTDNRLENLRWDTRSENLKDSFKNKRRRTKKLNSLQVRIIKHLLNYGKITQREIAQIFKVNRSTISRIKTRKHYGPIPFGPVRLEK